MLCLDGDKINRMANKNPTPRFKGDSWTEAEKKLLKKLYSKTNNQKIADCIGHNLTAGAVRAKAVALGLKKGGRFWNDSDKSFLLKNWGKLSLQIIAEKLKRTEWSVIAEYRKLKKRKGL